MHDQLIIDQYPDGVCVDRAETVVHQHQHGTLVGRMVDEEGAESMTQVQNQMKRLAQDMTNTGLTSRMLRPNDDIIVANNLIRKRTSLAHHCARFLCYLNWAIYRKSNIHRCLTQKFKCNIT